jgi:hypothetical protein
VPLRACIFIDSLDEYEGSEEDVIEVLHLVANSSNMKCCVSSRPSPSFQTALGNKPQLPLERLTFADMTVLAAGRLLADPRVERLAAMDSAGFQTLVRELVVSAHGNFLWLDLAIGCILRSHHDQDGLAKMRGRLQGLPRQLVKLYKHIIILIRDSHDQEASRALKLVIAASTRLADDWRVVTPLTLLSLSFAIEDHPNLALSAPLHFLTRADSQRRSEDTASRLQTSCAGLLRIQRANGRDDRPSPLTTVSFSHPTVRDFLMKEETLVLLRQHTRDSDFNANLAILKSKILLMKSEQLVSSSSRLSYHHVDDGIVYARRAEADFSSRDGLNQTISELLITSENWFRLNTVSQPIFHPGCTKYTIAVQCGLSRYLRHLLGEDNIVSRENPKRTGKRTLLSLALLPPSGFEGFVSPRVVETLLEFGANAAEAAQLTVAFIARRKTPRRDESALVEWKELLKKVLPKIKQLHEDDVQALQAMYEGHPDHWAEVQRAVQSSGVRVMNIRRKDTPTPLAPMRPRRRKILSIF